MPIYMFKCPECKEVFSRVLQISERDEPQKATEDECQCGKELVRDHSSEKGSFRMGRHNPLKR